MNVEIYQIDEVRFGEMVDSPEAISAAKLSSDIIVAMFDSQPLCFIGLIPQTMVSESAYVWMITTEAGAEHKLIIARHAREFLNRLYTKYSTLFGHCFELKSENWLRSLGAEFTAANVFELRRE